MKDIELPTLTPEEEKAAIREGRIKKYYRLKFSDYWRDAEERRGPVRQLDEKGPVKQLMK